MQGMLPSPFERLEFIKVNTFFSSYSFIVRVYGFDFSLFLLAALIIIFIVDLKYCFGYFFILFLNVGFLLP